MAKTITKKTAIDMLKKAKAEIIIKNTAVYGVMKHPLIDKELNNAIIKFAKNKYKHFMKIDSVTCLGPTEKQPVATIGEVDIMKPAIKLKFVCTRCGTEFNAPKYKCENYQTGMNEFEYTFSCPECHDRCYSHEEVK